MILCPNCLHRELVGAYFCSECGAQLVYSAGVPTSSIRSTGPMRSTGSTRSTGSMRSTGSKSSTGSFRSSGSNKSDSSGSKTAVPPIPVAPPPASTNAVVSLNIIVSGDIIPLYSQSDETTLGRISEGQPIIPDVDLTPYKAYEAGVSRMHASIRFIDEQVTITDLGSANGTRINGMKISSHIPHPIKHGDILTLGKFKIQVLLRNT
jgi:hypothetical protein